MILRAVSCLLIGLALATSVAWSAALFVRPVAGAASRPSGVGEVWSYWVGRQWATLCVVRVPALFALREPMKSDYLAVRTRDVPHWSGVYTEPQQRRPATFIELARGWPLLAFRTEIEIPGGSQSSAGIQVRSGWIINADTARDAVVLPLQPIWGGLIFNALVFGSVAFGILHGYGMVRGATRLQAGRCTHCGYDLRGSESSGVCSECGATAVQSPV